MLDQEEIFNNFRYDRSSKCFSYVPAKSLKEHYTAPKKPPQRRPSVERSNLDIPESVARESLREVNLTPIDLARRPETPKWDAEIDKVCPVGRKNKIASRALMGFWGTGWSGLRDSPPSHRHGQRGVRLTQNLRSGPKHKGPPL